MLTGEVPGVIRRRDTKSCSDFVGCIEDEGSSSVGGGEVAASCQESYRWKVPSLVMKKKKDFRLEQVLTVDNSSDFSVVLGKSNSSNVGIVTGNSYGNHDIGTSRLINYGRGRNEDIRGIVVIDQGISSNVDSGWEGRSCVGRRGCGVIVGSTSVLSNLQGLS